MSGHALTTKANQTILKQMRISGNKGSKANEAKEVSRQAMLAMQASRITCCDIKTTHLDGILLT